MFIDTYDVIRLKFIDRFESVNRLQVYKAKEDTPGFWINEYYFTSFNIFFFYKNSLIAIDFTDPERSFLIKLKD